MYLYIASYQRRYITPASQVVDKQQHPIAQFLFLVFNSLCLFFFDNSIGLFCIPVLLVSGLSVVTERILTSRIETYTEIVG